MTIVVFLQPLPSHEHPFCSRASFALMNSYELYMRPLGPLSNDWPRHKAFGIHRSLNPVEHSARAATTSTLSFGVSARGRG